jgi:hypothetical protein
MSKRNTPLPFPPIRLPAGARLARSCILLMLLACGCAAHAQTRVVVAAEPWEHLLFLDAQERPSGVIADFILRMNAVQDRFHFELTVLPRLRVDKVFMAGQADVYPLRAVAWTEPALRLRPTKTLVVARDVYFARRDNPHGAEICNGLASRHLAAVRGYHYRVFNNNPDPNYIKRRFKAELLPSNDSVVQFVRLGRAEVGIVPEAILATYFADAAIRDQLLVCAQPDSQVGLSNLVREGGPISVEQMNGIVEAMEKAGDLERLHAAMTIRR